MENLTIGQFVGIITAILAGVVAFVKGIEYLLHKVGHGATKWLQKGLAPTNEKIDALNAKIDDVDLSQCKNFLVRFLADVEQGNAIDEVEKERFYETYRHYTEDLHKNTYIHDKVEKLKKENKL